MMHEGGGRQRHSVRGCASSGKRVRTQRARAIHSQLYTTTPPVGKPWEINEAKVLARKAT